MNNINKNKVGLTFGIISGVCHLFWSVLVFTELAQPLIDFIFKIHMIEATHIVGNFNSMYAVSLVVITSIIGYIVGYIFASVWNKVNN